MSTLDLINGTFESLSGVMILNHCRVLYREKKVRGVSVFSTAFFVIWGIWNMIYYPSLGQTFSFCGGIAITVSNGIWVGMMIFYRRKEANTVCHLKIQDSPDSPL